jgi:5-methylcytosine-specific restriction protein A
MKKALKFCNHPGCSELVTTKYCEEHEEMHIDGIRERRKREDDRRGSAKSRGYDYAWTNFSRAYLSRPENQFCRLGISKHCKQIAECVDHIKPLSKGGGKYDPDNLQPACLACNSMKGDREIRGTKIFGQN